MKKKEKKIKIHVCSHTHWDREWYGSFQEFRFRLTKLIKKLLDILDRNKDYRFFTLDGQTVILEDYLEIYKEDKLRLEKYIREGRILIGPWYVLADEFLESGESIIKNLLIGKKIGEEYGNWMKVGYLPDMFGHIAQMPQILKGFDIKYAIIWRGIQKKKRYKYELLWESPDNTKILTVQLPDVGYSNFCLIAGLNPSLKLKKEMINKYGEWKALITDIDDQLKILKFWIEKMKPRSETNILLFLNGVDHQEPESMITELINKANQKFQKEDIVIEHSNPVKFFEEIEEAVNINDLEIIKGIQRDTVFYKGQGAIILYSVLSSRIHNKIFNRKIENFLEHYSNPACFLAKFYFNKNYMPFIEKSYKWLLKNHPHDSIGGCSVDEVHRQMDLRFEWAYEISQKVFYDAVCGITEKMKLIYNFGKEDNFFGVFNPLPYEREEVIECIFPVPMNHFKNDFYLRSIDVKDCEDRIIESSLIEEGMEEDYNYFWQGYFAPLERVKKIKFLIKDKLPPFGFKFYVLKLKDKPVFEKNFISQELLKLENEYLKVEINQNGTLEIYDKVNNNHFCNLNFFEESGDAGDTYTYSPPLNDEVYTTLNSKPQISLIENNYLRGVYKIEYNLTVPVELTSDWKKRSKEKKELKIVSYVGLRKGSKIVEIKTEVRNNIKDHIIKIGFNTGIQSNLSFAEEQFDIQEFPVIIEQPDEDVWEERQPEFFPVQRFCGLREKGKGIAIFTKHLPEYSVRKNGTLYLTLLRSVGYLSRMGLLTRKGMAGPFIPTPEAQLLGKLISVEYAIFPFNGDILSSGLIKEVEKYCITPSIAVSSPSGIKKNFFKNFINPLFSIEGNIAYSTLKQSEKEEDIFILRLWNPFDSPQKIKLNFFINIKEFYILSLSEEVLKKIEPQNPMEFYIKPKKIFSLGFRV